MGNVRVVMVEVDGSDETVRAAVSAIAERLGESRKLQGVAAVQMIPAAPSIEPPRQLPKPMQNRRKAKHASSSAKTAPAVEAPGPEADELRCKIVSLLEARPPVVRGADRSDEGKAGGRVLPVRRYAEEGKDSHRSR